MALQPQDHTRERARHHDDEQRPGTDEHHLVEQTPYFQGLLDAVIKAFPEEQDTSAQPSDRLDGQSPHPGKPHIRPHGRRMSSK